MPMYTFECPKCKTVVEAFRTIERRNAIGHCPCGGPGMVRIFDPGGNRGMIKEFHTPIEMLSLAVNNDEEIAAFRTRNPDVEIGTDRSDPMRYGVPVARTRREKLAILKAEKYVETN